MEKRCKSRPAMRLYALLLLCALLCSVFPLPFSAHAQDAETVVRVGWH